MRHRARFLPVLAPVLGLALAAFQGVASASVFEAYRRLETVGDGVRVGPLETEIGHLQLRLTSGVLTPVRSGAGRHVGWYFRGEGRYTYATADPADQAVFKDNVHRVSRQLTAVESGVTDGFKEMLILKAGIDLPALAEAAPLPADGSAAGASAAPFDAMWQAIQLGDLEFDHYAAAIDANGPPDQYAYVELSGGVERVGYSYDRHRDWSERLFAFRKFQGVDFRFREYLSRQLLPGRDEAPADVKLTHADLRVATPDNKEGTVGGRLSLEIVRSGTQVAVMWLMNNRDPSSERWQSEKKALKITRLTDGEGTPLDYSHRYDELAIDFGRPLAEGDEVVIDFAADAAIFTDADGEYADNYRDLAFVTWYPTPRAAAARRFTYTLEARCKPPFRVVASGDTVFDGQEEGLNVVRTRSDVPAADVAVFLGKYTTHEQVFGDLTVKVHGYGTVRKSDLEQMANLTAMFTDIYSQALGPYPHHELEVVELPTFSFFGVSPPGLVILTSRSFEPTNQFLREYLGNRGVNSLIAHEVAHQWFGHRAWPADPFLDNWLTESFAEYMSGLAMGVAEQRIQSGKGAPGKGPVKGLKSLHAEWWRYANEVEGRGAIRGANRLSGELSWEYRVDLLYNRGPLVLHQLRSLVGEQRFLQIMRKFLDGADFGPATTDDVARAASEVVGEDLQWYFDQWVNQAGIPTVEVEQHIVSEGGKAVLEGQVRQSGAEFFKLHVPLVLQMPGGQTEVRLLLQTKPVQDFRYELAATPAKVLVDPGGNNLAHYR